MSDPVSESDHQLLARYARDHAEAAFVELVRRHVNLVHSAALRQLRSPQLAEEVAQSVFTDLARNAAKLTAAPDPAPVLTAWLYQVTRRTAIDVVRREARRQLREQIATDLNAMNATAADWTHIEPLLDEAMAALDEIDRTAVLLRYFENKPLREVGITLGTSDDAAQKRVSRAVERLREFFAKRGVSVGASGLAVVISANAVQAAPVGLALTISTAAALTGATLATTATVTATKAIAMTALQKTIVTATIAVLAGAGIYEARQVAQLREQNQALQQQQAPLTGQIQQLESESKERTSQLVTGNGNQNKINSLNEVLRLRAEVTRLRGEAGEPSAESKDALAFQAKVLEVLSNTAPVRTFVATSSLSVPWDQTIGLGGWKTPSGKRAMVLATVERGGDSQQVSIRSKVIEYTEAGGIELGLSGFNDDEQKPKGTITLDSKQTADLLRRVQNSEEVSLANGMTVITASGRQAQIQAVDVRATPSGEKYFLGPILDVVPTVANDGQSVQVVMTAQLNYRIPLPTP